MLEKEKNVLKLQDFLRRKNPQLRKEELERISNQLYELAGFWVGLKIKQHLKTSRNHKDGILNYETRKVS